jgi:hypothetical protein
MNFSKLNRFTSTLLLFSILGFAEISILAISLSLETFGLAVLTISLSLLIYGTLEIRWWEFTAFGSQKGLTFARARNALLLDFAALLFSVLFSSIVISLKSGESILLLGSFSCIGLAPAIANALRFWFHFCDQDGVRLFYLIALRLSVTLGTLFVFFEKLNLAVGIVILTVLALLAFTTRSFLSLYPGIRHLALDQNSTYKFRKEISSSFFNSLASSVYRNSDLLIIGFMVGATTAASFRMWQLVLAPIAIFTEIQGQRRMTLLLANYRGGLFASKFLYTHCLILIALGLAGYAGFNLLLPGRLPMDKFLGLLLFLVSVVAYINNLLRISLIESNGYRPTMVLAWSSVLIYLMALGLLWGFVGGIYLVVLIRLFVSLLVLALLVFRVFPLGLEKLRRR